MGQDGFRCESVLGQIKSGSGPKEANLAAADVR